MAPTWDVLLLWTCLQRQSTGYEQCSPVAFVFERPITFASAAGHGPSLSLVPAFFVLETTNSQLERNQHKTFKRSCRSLEGSCRTPHNIAILNA